LEGCPTPTKLLRPGAVQIAIDMAKTLNEVLIERLKGGRRRRMTVMATKERFDRFAE
jgi:hypothetical protein